MVRLLLIGIFAIVTREFSYGNLVGVLQYDQLSEVPEVW